MKTSFTLIKACCFASLIFSLSGCVKYQYATLSSNLEHSSNNTFAAENDSVKVVYDFNGENGPVKISIYNKLDTPLFVDWKMSSIIVDGKSSSYWKDESTIQATTDNYQINWTKSFSTTSGELSGTVTKRDDISFIPPGSHIDASLVNLRTNPFSLDGEGQKTKMITSSGTQVTKYLYSFSDNDSPLRFKSYLTLSLQKDFKSSFTLKDDFWVNEVFDSYDRPAAYAGKTKKADTFYTRKPSGMGIFLASVGILSLTLLYASQ